MFCRQEMHEGKENAHGAMEEAEVHASKVARPLQKNNIDATSGRGRLRQAATEA